MKMERDTTRPLHELTQIEPPLPMWFDVLTSVGAFVWNTIVVTIEGVVYGVRVAALLFIPVVLLLVFLYPQPGMDKKPITQWTMTSLVSRLDVVPPGGYDPSLVCSRGKPYCSDAAIDLQVPTVQMPSMKTGSLYEQPSAYFASVFLALAAAIFLFRVLLRTVSPRT